MKSDIQFDFRNRNVLIAAGTKGIGLAVAKIFLTSGARISICSRNSEHLKAAIATLETLTTQPNGYVTTIADLGEPHSIQNWVSASQKFFNGPIDTLITNSGGPPPKIIQDVSEQDWQSSIQVNLMSVIQASQWVLPDMLKIGFGRLIHLTSTIAKEPKAGMVLSSVTRSGVAAYSKTLAHEYGPNGITSNIILTGGIRTERLENLLWGSSHNPSIDVSAAIRQIESTIPVRYLAQPDEIAKLVAYLASKDASYVNGAAIAFDGGVTSGLF